MSTIGMKALGLTHGPDVTDEAVAAAAEVIGVVIFGEPPETARADPENISVATRVLQAAAPLMGDRG